MLAFWDREKVEEISNVELTLVITVILADHTVEGFLVDDGNLCNVLYANTLEKLGLRYPDLSS